MTILWYAIVSVILALISFLTSMLGIGGGVLYTPLQLFLGIDIHHAATNSLFFIMLASISAGFIYRKAGKVDFKLVALLESPTLIGAFIGGYISGFISSNVLMIILIITLLFSGIMMLRKTSIISEIDNDYDAWFVWKREFKEYQYGINLFVALPCSFVAGVVSSLVGVGGGVLKVPIMIILLNVPVEIAISVSMIMVGITALGGFAGHLIHGHWDWRFGLILGPIVFIAAKLGAKTMLHVNKAHLKKGFAVFMFLIVISLIVRLIFFS